MVSSRADCRVPPGSDDEVVKERAHVVVCERVRLTQGIQLYTCRITKSSVRFVP